MHLENTALVLEGGGMRGMFSAGVFEAFLLKNITFPYITAVSAGACNILSYMSKQPLRTRKIIENYVSDKRYCCTSQQILDTNHKKIYNKKLSVSQISVRNATCDIELASDSLTNKLDAVH